MKKKKLKITLALSVIFIFIFSSVALGGMASFKLFVGTYDYSTGFYHPEDPIANWHAWMRTNARAYSNVTAVTFNTVTVQPQINSGNPVGGVLYVVDSGIPSNTYSYNDLFTIPLSSITNGYTYNTAATVSIPSSSYLPYLQWFQYGASLGVSLLDPVNDIMVFEPI